MAQKSKPRVHTKRTYYDYQDQQIHGEYQNIQTPTNRYCKRGDFKEFNIVDALWRKLTYSNNRAERK